MFPMASGAAPLASAAEPVSEAVAAQEPQLASVEVVPALERRLLSLSASLNLVSGVNPKRPSAGHRSAVQQILSLQRVHRWVWARLTRQGQQQLSTWEELPVTHLSEDHLPQLPSEAPQSVIVSDNQPAR